jgi:hypothetical protein
MRAFIGQQRYLCKDCGLGFTKHSRTRQAPGPESGSCAALHQWWRSGACWSSSEKAPEKRFTLAWPHRPLLPIAPGHSRSDPPVR